MHTVALLTVAALTCGVARRERNATGASFDRNFIEKKERKKEENVGEGMRVTRMWSTSRVSGIIVEGRRRSFGRDVGMKERDGPRAGNAGLLMACSMA